MNIDIKLDILAIFLIWILKDTSCIKIDKSKFRTVGTFRYNNPFNVNASSSNRATLAACDCGWRNTEFLNIVNGEETGVHEFPAMAGLVQVDTGALYCGSTIISDRYLLTAAHCVYGISARNIAVLVGDHNISTGTDTPYAALYLINGYVIHPSYNFSTYENDVGIIQTSSQIITSTYVAPICLPFYYYTTDFSGQQVTILGWGQIEFSGPTSDTLQKANLDVISNAQCNYLVDETINNNEICTYTSGRDSCQSDSGGPLLWTNPSIGRMFLVGIISHGRGCAFGYPGINTRVTYFLDWILSMTSDATYCAL
ncbi:venom serine protease-like [Sitophilus oryzae]|uniref:Venom serine protease-like n=1 Tax=Sitophilus oryzae TaxID=7048 RepID=A0A6J2XJI1_SITOR|nr:venom serine protease-like [Sitophilus oryzae]